MRFFTNEKRVKRDAKRLRKSLGRHGYELKHVECLDLMARLHGFSRFTEWKSTVCDGPLSLFDEDADDAVVEARFQHQERVMAEAGYADVAGAVLDEVNPTGLHRQPPCSGDKIADDAGSISSIEQGAKTMSDTVID
jgi:hypothetical protein